MPQLSSKLALCSLPVALLAVGSAFGQQDFSAITIKTNKLTDNLYYLDGVGGNAGGNVGVLIGDDGVLMIDDQFAPLSEKLQAAIKALSNKPIRMLINTHVHGDHTGGNENFGKLGVDIIAHDNVRVRLAKPATGNPAAAVALPIVTYGDKMSLHLNGETITIGKLPPAHTDGDSYIHFAKADVIHVGDVFRTIGYPGVDGGNGGTVKGTIAALQAIVEMAGPNTKILPGHGVVSTRDDVARFRDNTIEAQRRITDLIKQGMTLEQVLAANPTADLAPKFITTAPPPDKATTDRFLTAFYNAVKSEL